ncbi:SH3 domain and tetratricopeptide repeat-containing protein 2 isoform X2 [Xenopus laevis]|uniref:SH3 domain and tetratricopeptide repeat-containing protein 2 isoform X2 n=1 Tax=Xenopus laevis TaxID=8355 RepID=A0A8J1MK69_XENLA|nr:SH3 domain and tetratricopeptide repeat-containing protein 2 isoform X2 [Xenopus laevis]
MYSAVKRCIVLRDRHCVTAETWHSPAHSPLSLFCCVTHLLISMGCCVAIPCLRKFFRCPVSSSGKEERRGSGFLAGWPHWQEYSRNRQERCSSIEAMASDDAEDSELVCEAEESPVGKESVSLAVGEGFITEIPLSFSILQRSTQGPNVRLQEAARKMLWALENDNKDISMLFKELSARLVSIQASQDLFLITFKTVEEIWKFTTYLSLGFVACSLEHLLFDERYWLNSALVEDTEIHVSINQDQLARLYLGLLLQEGNFYAKSVVSSGGGIEFDEGNSEFLEVRLNDVVHIKDVGDESAWEGQSLSTGERGLVPIVAVEPLSHPFYQWFLKTYPVSCNIMDPDCLLGTSQPIGEGFCIATDNHVATGWDELSYITGDTIEVVGFFIPGLKWFVGRCPSNGVMGFVRTNNVDTSCLKALDKDLLFLSEEERSFLNVLDDDTQKGCMDLLSSLCQTDISSVYRLDGMEPMGIYMKASPVINEDLGEIQITESWEECEAVSGSSKGSASEKSSPDSEWKGEVEGFHIQAQDDIDDPKFFVDLNTGEVDDSEVFEPVLTFLNKEGYQVYFQPLYDLPMSFLSTTFYGFSEEEDLVFYLETSRNWAKKSQMTWSHIRCCFLLGRICAKRMKLSQARVYFEEALSATRQGFLDLHLLRALYGNLAAIYLKQNMKPKQDLLVEKAASLLACLPHHNFSSEIEFEVLKYILRKSIIVNNVSSEARTCFLIFRLLQQLGRYDEALPFVERLQFLLIASCSQTLNPTLGVMPILSYFYDKKYLPRVALASSKLCKTVGIKIMQSAMWRAGIVIQNIYKITEGSLKNNYIPAQAAPYLKHALSCSYESGDVKAQRTLCLILSKLYLQYKLFSGAICYSKRAAELGRWTSDEEAFESSVFLGWMYVLDGHYEQACKILMLLLESMQETDSTTQCGVVHNLLANAKKMDNNVIEASRGYTQALKMATETGNRRNQAIVMANFGRLSLSCQAVVMAESYFLHSVQLYIEVQGSDEAERELVQVLHWLGQIFTQQRILEKGILCYELALMFALKSNNLKSQLSIIEELCNFYSKVCPVTATHIIYCEHWMYLVQLLKDKRKEGELLSTLSQLYQTLNTAKSLRKALDYTKQSLRISIDLGQRDQAAENWLQAGRLYYMMGEQELVEIYLYAAIQASQKAQDIAATLRLYEAAGDVFFHGVQRRERAMYFYKEGALPLAKKVQDTEAQLRLFHKLTQLLVSQGHYKKSVEYATMAVRLSASVESPLDELVAFHRLAGVYYSQRIYEIAEYCYLKALSLCPSPMQHDAETGYYLKIYWRLGNIALLKRKDAEDAATYFLLALAAAIGIENEEFQLVLSNKLMDIYGKFLLNEEQADNFRKLLVQLSMKST